MKQKIAITLDSEILTFLDSIANGNRSDCLNQLLRQHQAEHLKQEMIQALQEDLDDPNYQQELQDWDAVAGDGLDA